MHGDDYIGTNQIRVGNGQVLQRPSRYGLYPWPSPHHSSSKHATIVDEKVSMDQWHLQLGHPSRPVVRLVIKFNKLPLSPSRVSSNCSSCQQGKSHRLHFGSSSSI